MPCHIIALAVDFAASLGSWNCHIPYGDLIITRHTCCLSEIGERGGVCRKMKGQGEVVEVLDSPPPPKSITSPMPSTPPLARRRAEMCAFTKKGARVKRHRLMMTCMYNPHQRHHSAYACVIHVTKKKITHKNIMKLREDTAKNFKESYEVSRKVGGVNLL